MCNPLNKRAVSLKGWKCLKYIPFFNVLLLIEVQVLGTIFKLSLKVTKLHLILGCRCDGGLYNLQAADPYGEEELSS